MFISEKSYFFGQVLKFDEKQVKEIVSHKQDCYSEFEIYKKNGKRTIYAIKKQSGLYNIQNKLKDNLFAKISLPVAVKGFVCGESYNTYLVEHVKKTSYLRADIKEFFNSITSEQIRVMLKEFINIGDIVDIIIDIVTLDDSLPQGAVTSPCISNAIFKRIDQRITKYCQEFDVTYTRYADDMLFSSNKVNFTNDSFFYSMIKKILKENGFECNYNKKKTENGKICLGGFVIRDDVHLSRAKLNNINKLIYFFRENKNFNSDKYSFDRQVLKNTDWLQQVNKLQLKANGKIKTFDSVTQLLDYLCGYRAFLISIVKNNNSLSSHTVMLSKKIKNIEKIIDAIIEKV
ncbi:MAG: reverse transcriptase family protein [bacterium]|nr:reverse transcriptase family protein [bacterium]